MTTRPFVRAVLAILSFVTLGVIEATPAQAASTHIAPCDAQNLWGAYLGSAGATGNLIYTIVVINRSDTTCRLAGYPTMEGVRNNHQYALPSSHGTYAGNLVATILRPRMSGMLLLSTADNCNALNIGGQTKIKKVMAANTYAVLGFTLPISKGLVMVPSFHVDIACGLGVSQLGWEKG